jgi:hypothetical protein
VLFVVGGNETLDTSNRQIGEIAVPVLMPTAANEVVELAAVPPGSSHVHKPLPAQGAEDSPDEVVAGILSGAVASETPTSKDLLDLLKRLLRNEPRMRALVLHPLNVTTPT